MIMLNYRKITLIHIMVLFFLTVGLMLPMESVQATLISGLYNTGVDNLGAAGSLGSNEMHYAMTGPSSPAIVISKHPNWVSAPSGSAWIGPSNGDVSDPSGLYSYQLFFDLTNVNLSTVQISGDWATDNSGKIYLNNNDTGVFKGSSGFVSLDSFTITSQFNSGINTLDFRVTNDTGTVGNPVGLLVANLNGVAKPVPEPTTIFLLGSGFAGLAVFRKKFKK
jgi:hypothetical protein